MNILKQTCAVIIVIFSAVFTTSCSTNLDEYKGSTPRLDIKEYFNGPLIAWGMIQDHNGTTIRRFCVELVGTWQNNIGDLKETFYFDDGEISHRNWQLTRLTKNTYTGNAEDVIGTASGQQNGFAFQWQYELSVKIDGTQYHFSLDDWMYQIDQYRVFNKTKMNKFGVTVADITLFFDKQQPLRQCQTI